MKLIYTLLVAHFVADFLAQSDWMALNKSKRWDALALHVVVYLLALCAIVGAASLVLWRDTSTWQGALAFFMTNAAAHFVQDALTSRLTSRLWFIDGVRTAEQHYGTFNALDVPRAPATRHEVAYNNKRHWFFVAIGFDQLLHYVTLFVTAGWWL